MPRAPPPWRTAAPPIPRMLPLTCLSGRRMASAPPPLACHFATLLRAIRSTDKERRSIERRSCVKNLATRLGCIGALHPPAALGLSGSAAMENLRFDRDRILCPTVIGAPLTTGVGVCFLTACGIELAIHHAARHGQFLLDRAWGRASNRAWVEASNRNTCFMFR